MSAKPIIVIQGASSAKQVPGIESIACDAELRFAESADEVARALPGADVLLGWNFREATLREIWPHADCLRWVHWTGAGVDAVLFPELVESEVILTNSRGVFDRAMAEYVLGLILSFAKGFQETANDQRERQWRHRLGEMIIDSRALVIGVGSIGREIARMLARAGMHVEGVGRRARAGDDDFEAVHARENLNSALTGADYVIIVVPLTDETRGLFGAEQLRAMKSTARLINVARGAILDEDALVKALDGGQIAGAALDVTAIEPLPQDSPLWANPKIMISPHMSGDFFGHYEALVSMFLRNFQRFTSGQPLFNVVDKVSGFVLSSDDPTGTREPSWK
jgi:phosphoglycerate dehydrogenase-like enzyme